MITDVCKVIAIAAIAAAAAAAIHFGVSSAGAADNSTQNYSPSRFALLAAQILAVSDADLAAKLDRKRASDAAIVLEKDAKVMENL